MVKTVQDIVTSCGKVYMSTELREHTLGVSEAQIPSQDEQGISVSCLLVADELLKFSASLQNSCQKNSSKFPRQVEWPALNDPPLQQPPQRRR